jgi:2-aminoadipate transaminase
MSSYQHFFSRAGESLRQSAIRQMGSVLAQSQDMVSFAPGYPAEELFPWAVFEEIAGELLASRDGSVLQYGPTRGYRPLRDTILELMRSRGIAADLDQVLVTTGSQQGLDLVGRVLLDPGDVVLMELPSYVGAIAAFRNVGASLVGIPQEADGLDLDYLSSTVTSLRREGRRVKFLYLVPNFQNPTGLLIGLDKRVRVLEWAAAHDILIVEDDPYRDLYFPDVTREEETRPVAADDRDGRVIYMSSFSKTLAPGLRVAWISAPPEIAAKLELAKQAEDLCAGALDQRIVDAACRRGLLGDHVASLRTAYQGKRDAMTRALDATLAGRLAWMPPRGGFFLWARLADGLSSTKLLEYARARRVIFVIGDAFFVDGSGADYLRLSFSAPSIARIGIGIERLAAAFDDMRGVVAAPDAAMLP